MSVTVLETIAQTRAALDAARASGKTVGFVPTMGYLHDGHASLIARARAENDVVLVSIFVNPTQFGPSEDLAAYPRDLDRDLKVCESEGADFVFHPSVGEMYGGRARFCLDMGEIGEKLCGASRPGHFNGVALVVSKLFNIAGPCRAYFGEKDAQQLVVIRRLALGLDFPVEVVGCPIVREPDGLAMSSRNVYLEPEDRRAALALKAALDEADAAARQGERDGRRIAGIVVARVSSEPRARLEYAACVDPESLDDLEQIDGAALIAVAAWFGKARLIDNITVTP